MNNLQKSLRELFRVNLEAGLLRLFLAAVLIFILWSLLAILSASFDPLGNLEISNTLGFNSQNLALSLFIDIINAYFSIFTISLIILFFIIVFFGFETIADFYSHLKSLPSNRISKNYLSHCAFSLPKRKKFLFPDHLNNPTDDYPSGPFEAVIKPGFALLVGSRENYSVKFNNRIDSENFEVSLTFREKILDCFNLNPASISFNIDDQSFVKSFFIEVEYVYDLPSGQENMAKFANMLALCDSGKIRKIIENNLISEIKVALGQYFRNSSGFTANPFKQVYEEPIGKKENTSKELDQKKYSMVINFYKKVKDQVIKRNRKRPVYLNPSHSVAASPKNYEENLSPSIRDQINDLLAMNLQSSMLTLFGTNIIVAKINKIQEQG